jgi:hypothetical protein
MGHFFPPEALPNNYVDMLNYTFGNGEVTQNKIGMELKQALISCSLPP